MRRSHLKEVVVTALCIVAGVLMVTAVSAANSHKLIIQVGSDDEKVQEIALNNITNLLKAMGNDIQIELVAYGPGVMMLSAENPDAKRVTDLALHHNVAFSVCGSTLAKIRKTSGTKVVPAEGVRIVPTGLGRIIELQRTGWAQVRP